MEMDRRHLQALLDTMHAALEALEPDATEVDKQIARAALLINSRMAQAALAREYA